jgi:hypothetical protein
MYVYTYIYIYIYTYIYIDIYMFICIGKSQATNGIKVDSVGVVEEGEKCFR